MKMKFLLVGMVSAILGVSAAVAAPQVKPPAKGGGCKPKVTVVLKGTVAVKPDVSATTLSVNVTKANRHGRAYVSASAVTVNVDTDDTTVHRQGKKTLGDLLSGDRVLVQARACKADLAGGATPLLTASKVVAHPAA